MKSSQSVLFIVFHTKRIVAYDGMRVNENIAFIVFILFSDCKLFVKAGDGWEPTLPGERLCKPGMGGASFRFPLGWELRWASKQPILSATASRIDLSLLSVAQRKIFRKPHPSPAFVTLWTAAWILANSAYGKLVAIHILSGEQTGLRSCRYQMYTEHILKPNSRHNQKNVLIDRYDIF